MELLALLTPLLQHATLLLALCNETVLFFDYWIYTPAIPSTKEPWPANHFADPITAVLIYAIVEPLSCKAIIWLSSPPWIYLLILQTLHLQFTQLSAQELFCSAVEERLTATAVSPNDAAALEAETKSDDAAAPWKPVLATLDRCTLLYAPVVSAAMTNATLLLFAHSLHAPGMATTTFGTYFEAFVQVFAVVFYLIMRYMTRLFGPSTHRPQMLHTLRWDRHSLIQGLHLGLLLSARLGVRLIAQVDIFPVLGLHDVQRANELYGPDRFEWITQFYAKLPRWLPVAASALSPFSQIAIIWWRNRELKKNLQKLERLAVARLENGEQREKDETKVSEKLSEKLSE